MGRKILFRVKNNKNEWIYGFYSPLIWYLSLKQILKGKEIEVKLDTLGIYAGLKDKNGTEIFEGDIVKCDGHLCEITFKKGLFCYNFYGDDYPLADSEYGLDLTETEVVGNIWENKELLEK